MKSIACTTLLVLFFCLGCGDSRIEQVKRAAEAGNPDSQLVLGLIYENGANIENDAAMAAKWYQKAAIQKNGQAAFRLSILYASGNGVRQNDDSAVYWSGMAFESGYPEAKFERGMSLLQIDPDSAVKILMDAAKDGHIKSQTMLAVLADNGVGMKRDPEQATKWFRQAAEAGNSLAQFSTGLRLLGNDTLYIRAIAWMLAAHKNGLDKATNELDEITLFVDDSTYQAAVDALVELEREYTHLYDSCQSPLPGFTRKPKAVLIGPMRMYDRSYNDDHGIYSEGSFIAQGPMSKVGPVTHKRPWDRFTIWTDSIEYVVLGFENTRFEGFRDTLDAKVINIGPEHFYEIQGAVVNDTVRATSITYLGTRNVDR